MNKVGFWNPVHFANQSKSRLDSVLEFVDAIFHRSGPEAYVVPDAEQGKSRGAVLLASDKAFLKK